MWWKKSKEEKERRKKELEEKALSLYKMKMSVLKKVVEEKIPFDEQSIVLSKNTEVIFRLDTEQWQNLYGCDFYECNISNSKRVRKWKTDSIPQGLLFLLTFKQIIPTSELDGDFIEIFTAGRKFYTIKDNSYSSRRSPYCLTTYFWPFDADSIVNEYRSYFTAKTLGIPDATSLEVLRNKQK